MGSSASQLEWWPDSFASKLQRGRAARDVYAQQVRIRQLRGHAPERERDDAGGYLAHAELQQQHAAVTALAHEALVPSETLTPCRTLQKRVVAHPRHELPAAVRTSGDVLAADLEPHHAREHAFDVRAHVEELVAAWLLALKAREASLIVADSLVGKRLFDLSVHGGGYLPPRVVERGAEQMVPSIMGETGPSREDAYLLLVHNVQGNLAVNRLLGWRRGPEFAHARELLGAYSEGGMRAVSTRHDACGSS